MNLTRDFKGVWIPKHIWLSEELTMLDKVLLVEIDSLDQTDRGCFASNKYLAEFCQCSESAVSKSISKLTKLGFITCKNFDGRQRELKSNLNNLVKSNNVPSKIYEADEQNLRHINIVNNTDNNIDNISPDGQNSNIKPSNQLFSTPTKPKKKGENKYITVIEQISCNPDVRDALLKYCNFRRQRGLTIDQWSLIVQEFKKQSVGKTTKQVVECINQCIINGRNSLYYVEYQNNNIPKPSKTSGDEFDLPY